MSDLYRTNEPHAEEIHSLIKIGMLIKVEPCEHGMVMPHDWIDYKESRRASMSARPPLIIDCPGALEGTDDVD